MIEQFLIRQSVLGSVTNMLLSAGTLSSNRSDVTFADSNGVTFGLNTNGVITASVAGGAGAGSVNISAGTTSIVSTAFTFSNSNGVSWGINTNAVITATVVTTYAGQGFTTATTAGTAIVGTLSTNGLSMGVPAYLTTAMQSNAATISNVNISAGTTSTNASAFTFSNSNNVSFGINGQTITGSIATTYAGTGFTTATTAGTNIVGTLNTSGLSLGVPAYLTTAALSQDSSKYAGTGFTSTSTGGSNIVATLATNGLSMGVPNYLTTAMQSNAATISNIKISAGTLSQTRSDVTFADSNGVSWGLNTNGVVTASIATTYAGTGFTTATTTGTNIVGTLNTSGLSMGVPAFLTTAELSRQFLSYYANMPIVQGTVTTAAQSNTFYVMPVSIQEKLSISYLRLMGFGALTSTTIATSAVNNATGASTAFSWTMAHNAVLYTVGTGANSRSLQEVYSSSAGLTWAVSVSQASTSNASQQTITEIITFPRLGFTTNTTSNVFNVSATNGPISTTDFGVLAGNRYLDIPFATSLSAGNYWLALNRITGTVGGKNIDMNWSSHGVSQQSNSWGELNVGINSSNCGFQFGLGSWTTNVAQTTSSIGLASITVTSSYFMPYIQFINQA